MEQFILEIDEHGFEHKIAKSVKRGQLEWNACKEEFPGWHDNSANTLNTRFSLITSIGRWKGYVELVSVDGLFEGRWDRLSVNKLARAFGQKETTFKFESSRGLKLLLTDMEEWIKIRREPSTYRNGVSELDSLILSKATEPR